MKLKNKALFLDRDGVINKNFGYVFSMKNFIWLKNVKKAIKYAYTKKYLIILYEIIILIVRIIIFFINSEMSCAISVDLFLKEGQ